VAKAKKRLPKPANWRTIMLGVLLFVGLGVGLITVFKAGADQQRQATPSYASGADLEVSRKTITDTYLSSTASGCSNLADPARGPYIQAMFYKYLRVNIHNTRAVFRDCVGGDHLLARVDGEWQMTDVNMALDARVNPQWQKACDITDITRADDVIRPENRSIDSINYGLCRALQDNEILNPQEL
jgi:hypothetical protein